MTLHDMALKSSEGECLALTFTWQTNIQIFVQLGLINNEHQAEATEKIPGSLVSSKQVTSRKDRSTGTSSKYFRLHVMNYPSLILAMLFPIT